MLTLSTATQPEISAHTFATKSNPQRIQDGTFPPGVKYPRKVTRDNVNQKRTYHRMAERNRRNKFNATIQQMEALIPANFVKERKKSLGLALTVDSNPTKKETEKAPFSEQTKADVMEIAADYIKMLHATLNEKNERMNRLRVAGSDASV